MKIAKFYTREIDPQYVIILIIIKTNKYIYNKK